MHLKLWLFPFWLAVGFGLTACSPAASTLPPSPTSAATRTGQLTPFITPSATRAIQPTRETTPSPLPSPTATPRIHTVVKGEDLFGISLFYKVPLEEIIAANPTVNPRAMSIGTELIIPAEAAAESTATVPAGSALAAQQTPTPLPVESGPLHCTPAQDGGIWCFQLVRNPGSDYALEGLTGLFRLAAASGGAEFSQTAFLPLDLLPPGTALPLTSYFAPEVAQNLGSVYQASSELLSALPNPDDGRYIRSHLENQNVMISASGLSAEISMNVVLDQPDATAGRVWVAATAFDAAGQVVGVRRWEKDEDTPVEAGQPLAVSMRIYSVSGTINRVELVSEARP